MSGNIMGEPLDLALELRKTVIDLTYPGHIHSVSIAANIDILY